MAGFITRIFGISPKKESPPPPPPPAPEPAPSVAQAAAARPAQTASDKKRVQGAGVRSGRKRTVFTNPLGLSLADKSDVTRKYLLGS